MLREFSVFNKSHYPSNFSEAEKLCSSYGYDTLIHINKIGNMMGRGKNGVWTIGIQNNFERIYYAITYEMSNNRSVIFYSNDLIYDNEMYDNKMRTGFKGTYYCDIKYLCHSTDLISFINILKDEKILSYNSLTKKGININTLRFKLKEPKDYLDYVDLCDWLELSSERVVASREKLSINMDDNTIYNPQVRVYFKTSVLHKQGILSHDGIHIKVLNSIPLKYAYQIIIHNKIFFESQLKLGKLNLNNMYLDKIKYIDSKKDWTLKCFVEYANKLIEQYK